MPGKAVSHVRFLILFLVLALVAGNAISLYINLNRVKSQYTELASEVGRTFFQAIEAMRDWNTLHQGVYVPVSAGMRPNEYLVDPLRDITSTGGIHLTKINHAQMARMISELLDRQSSIHIHLTSLTPIRPMNTPDPWEKLALAAFAGGSPDVSTVQTDEKGNDVFRYMAPLKTASSCMTCHHEHKSVNEIRGGISVSFSFAPFQGLIRQRDRQIWLVHLLGLCAALVPVAFLGRKLLQNVEALQTSLLRVRQLEGLVPICANCKKIRAEGAEADVQTSWIPMETYIEDRTNAEFTHGLCPDCREKLYPELRSGRK